MLYADMPSWWGNSPDPPPAGSDCERALSTYSELTALQRAATRGKSRDIENGWSAREQSSDSTYVRILVITDNDNRGARRRQRSLSTSANVSILFSSSVVSTVAVIRVETSTISGRLLASNWNTEESSCEGGGSVMIRSCLVTEHR
jgi:hypothetical protein